MKAYKFLMDGRLGLFSDFRWPPPGEWVDAAGPVMDCLSGVHAVRFEQLLDWIDTELWEIELDGAIVERNDMLVAERGRLLRRVEAWDDAAALALAETCALRAAAVAGEALRRVGLVAHADELEAATTHDEATAAATAALDAAREVGMAEAVEFAADLVSLVDGRRPDSWRHPVAEEAIVQTPAATAANAAFVSAHAAGRVARAEHGDDAYDAGYAAERARQLDWLRKRLRS